MRQADSGRKRFGSANGRVLEKKSGRKPVQWAALLFIAFWGLVPAAFAGANPAQGNPADSIKNDSLDICGHPKPTATPATRSRTHKKNDGLVEGGPNSTAYFFLGSLCPCTDAHKHSIIELMSLAPKKGVKLVAVFPNKGESVELVEHFFKGLGFKMTYVIDSANRLVEKFGARKTPEVFLVNAKKRVVYSGPIDDSVENLGQVKNAYLKNALLDLAEGRPVAVPRAEGSGCWLVRNR